MYKNFIWILTLIISISTIFANTNACLTPDEYILKCEFDPFLSQKKFTCLNYDCSDKLYTLKDNIFLADYKTKNISYKIVNGQINLNQIKNNLDLVQTLCSEQISPKLMEIFEKKVFQTQSKFTQSFTGNFLTIEKQNLDLTLPNKQFNCYSSSYENYLGWDIEIREKKQFCEFDKLNNSCYSQSIDFTKLITGTSEFELLLKYSLILIFGIVLGIAGLFTHLLETKKIKQFFTITKSKIILSVILSFPILFLIGKMIDLMFFTTFITSKLMPALTFILAILMIYFFANLIHFTHETHKYTKELEKKKLTKKIIRNKKRI